MKALLGIAGGILAGMVLLGVTGCAVSEPRAMQEPSSEVQVTEKSAVNSQTSYYQTGEVPIKEQGITSVEFKNTASILEIQSGEQWKLSYDLDSPEKLKVRVEKDDDGEKELNITYPAKNSKNVVRNEKIVLTIPKDIFLESVDVENCLADISIHDLTLAEVDIKSSAASVILSDLSLSEGLDIDSAAGKTVLERVNASEFSAENIMGKIEAKDLTVTRELSVEKAMGKTNLVGSFPCSIELEKNNGSIFIQSAGTTENDYNYDIESNAGSLKIGSMDLGASYQKNNGKMNAIEMENNVGSIFIDFK